MAGLEPGLGVAPTGGRVDALSAVCVDTTLGEVVRAAAGDDEGRPSVAMEEWRGLSQLL